MGAGLTALSWLTWLRLLARPAISLRLHHKAALA